MINYLKHGVLLCAFSMSIPANAAVLYATSANITSIWNSAAAGDTIKLSGTFSKSVALQNRTFASAVTIDATTARFTGTLKLQAVNGVRVVGGTFDATRGPNAYGKAIIVYSSSNVSFDKTNVISIPSYAEAGIGFQNVTNGSVTNSTFTNVGVGVGVSGSNHVTLTGNKVIGSTKDGFDIFDDHFVLVANNSCSGSQPSAGAHPDCVQLASTAGHAPASDIKVINNIATGNTQGFTSFIGKAIGSERVIISGNIVNTTYSQGVACYSCVDSFITDNFIAAEPNAPHWVAVNVLGGTNNVVTGNSWLGGGVYLPTDYASAYFKLTGNAYVYDPGTLQRNGSTMPGSQSDFTSSSSFSKSSITGGTVPEPAEWMLMMLGFGIVGVAHRRHPTMLAA
ncbi:right-handed parallel beta-helix repeat-containing protein (plasmid) [Polymorphobacter sp. PAMC 29334]|uniref:right-handed parallel beta-helix repeat-containing protein n=1 Tax=Polymorphobacter sp. PAMC 29334 TaxID=2862331 RepID=UPI001C779573|nr:right-handed parallel beta-helix repeat-containing protein [Polymorphobacter sp. PAMC 29334]QYE33656.1 right-handed parallel beta-helix repeat-containing protein [Polymorphobacter sp. PAMC 29334]